MPLPEPWACPGHASVLFSGTALPLPFSLGLEQFGQHTAGLLQILESLGADSVRFACCRLGCSACAVLVVFASPCGEFAWDGRVSSWHICINI